MQRQVQMQCVLTFCCHCKLEETLASVTEEGALEILGVPEYDTHSSVAVLSAEQQDTKASQAKGDRGLAGNKEKKQETAVMLQLSGKPQVACG